MSRKLKIKKFNVKDIKRLYDGYPMSDFYCIEKKWTYWQSLDNLLRDPEDRIGFCEFYFGYCLNGKKYRTDIIRNVKGLHFFDEAIEVINTGNNWNFVFNT